MASKKTQYTQFNINGNQIPVQVVRERRRSMRVSVGKRAVILRMPSGIMAPGTQKGIDWSKNWLEELVRKKPDALDHLLSKSYNTGDQLKVGERTYFLDITYKDRKTHAAKLEGNTIKLSLNEQEKSGVALQKAIKHLLSRVVASDFLPEIERRVDDLNDRFFQKPFNKVSLKYNHSNWGSCSSKGNINLSTRLLFAPQEVIDYVIIHELAHLIERNHSNRFWALVEGAMPDYKDKVRFLKANGKQYDF
ncbi:MAG: M48 family peptidase [Bacteroidetes bacterium]|nr:MAG: M48 family peptidase [Bacteroidota bacterium]